jgi:methionyl-tRNA synthetase
VGKDNIVFHCIIFPAMLRAHGKFILPENVPANEFLNIEGEKVSTSRNWAVWVNEYINDFPNGQDALRYVLCANSPETKDCDFTWKEFQERNNNELVAVFGNFINRVFVLANKFTESQIPVLHESSLTLTDKEILAEIAKTKKAIEDNIEGYKFRSSLYEVIDLSRKGNKYLQEIAPWLLAKSPALQIENQVVIDNCIHICLQIIKSLAIFSHPFLPFTAKKICNMLELPDSILFWENAERLDLLASGRYLKKQEVLFKKVEDAEIKFQIEKLLLNRKTTAV